MLTFNWNQWAIVDRKNLEFKLYILFWNFSFIYFEN